MLVILGMGALFALSGTLHSAKDPLEAAGVLKLNKK